MAVLKQYAFWGAILFLRGTFEAVAKATSRNIFRSDTKTDYAGSSSSHRATWSVTTILEYFFQKDLPQYPKEYLD